jgi:fructose-1,6-bisphosphatase
LLILTIVLKFYLLEGEEQKKLDLISNEVFVKA